MEAGETNSLRRRLVSLGAIFVLIFICGTCLAWGTITVYLASYLHKYDASASPSTVAMSPFVYGLSWAAGAIIGTSLFHLVGGKLTIAAGVVLYAGGFAGSTLTKNMYAFLTLLLCTQGFGPALICLPATYLSWNCLPTRKGLATGIAWMGFGLGGMAYGLMFTFLVNPDNHSASKEVSAGNQKEKIFGSDVADRVPMAMIATGIALLVVGLGACLLVKGESRPEVRRQLSASVASNKTPPEVTDHDCPTLSRALKTSAFYLLFVYSWLSFQFPMVFLYQYKNYEQQHTANDHLLSVTGTVGLFCNSAARLLVPLMADFIQFRPLMISVSLLLMALAFTVQFVVEHEYAYMLWVCLVLLMHGGLYSPITLICREIYGARVGATVFSLVSQGLILSNLCMIPISFLLIEPYGFSVAFFAIGICSGLAALTLVVLRTNYSWSREDLRQKLADSRE